MPKAAVSTFFLSLAWAACAADPSAIDSADDARAQDALTATPWRGNYRVDTRLSAGTCDVCPTGLRQASAVIDQRNGGTVAFIDSGSAGWVRYACDGAPAAMTCTADLVLGSQHIFSRATLQQEGTARVRGTIEEELSVRFAGDVETVPCRCDYLLRGARSLSLHAAASDVDLAGRSYERTFVTQPLGSNEPTEFSHEVSFGDAQTVVDTASTFFGNPPENGTYKVKDDEVTLTLTSVHGDTYTTTYVLSEDKTTLTNEAGAVLRLRPRG